MYTLPRTESRGDGVACFVKEGIEVLDKQASFFPSRWKGGVGEGGVCVPCGER